MGKDQVVVCDTPGLGQHDPQTQTVEWEIANGLGMIRAIHRARTVKLVWVINREEVRIRERFFSATAGAAGLERGRRTMGRGAAAIAF